MTSRLGLLLIPVLLAAPLATAVAAGDDLDERGPAPEAQPVAPTPSGLAPGRAGPRAYAGLEGGWDGARGQALFETNVEAAVWGPLSFRAGAMSNPDDRRVSPTFTLKLDVLRQDRHGVAAAVIGGYRGDGLNLVPAVQAGLVLGRRFSRVGLVSSLIYNQGLERGERFGEVRVAGMTTVLPALEVGLDGRARLDLERDDDEPVGEATYDAWAGPLAVARLGSVYLSGQAGVSAFSLRAGGGTKMGPAARLGVGATF